MRALIPVILFGLFFMAAIVAGQYLFEHPGYVLFSYDRYYIEMTLVALLVRLFLLLMVVQLVIYLLRKSFGLFGASRNYFFNKSEASAKKALAEGLSAFALKDWGRAEKLLAGAGHRSGLLATKHLFAALAADAMDDDKKVERHLDALADLEDSDIDGSVDVLKAQLLLNQGEAAQAAALLTEARRKKANDAGLLAMHVKALKDAGDWKGLLELLPKVQKLAVYDDAEFDALLGEAVENALTDAVRESSIEVMHQIWGGIPGKFRKMTTAISAYILVMAEHGASGEAETLLMKHIKKTPVGQWLGLLRRLKLANVVALRDYLQQALKKQPDDTDLLCALGHVACQSGDNLLTAQALSKATEGAARPEDLKILAEAWLALGESQKAALAYRRLTS